MLYDQHAGDWCDELLEPAGLSRAACSPRSWRAARRSGAVTRAAPPPGRASPTGTPVVGGGHDHICSALALRAGEARAVDSTGTAEVVVVPLQLPAELDVERSGHIACYADVEPGRHILSARVGMAGALVEWARRTLYEGAPYDLILGELAAARRPSGMLCLSTFGRASTPHFDPETAVGTLVGLTTAHARGDVLLALLEGACYSLRANLERVEALGAPRSAELRAGGGAVRNPVWLQLKADVTGRPVVAVDARGDARCSGRRMLACVGAGIDADAGSRGASHRPVRPEDRARPRTPRGVRPPVRGLPGARPAGRRGRPGQRPLPEPEERMSDHDPGTGSARSSRSPSSCRCSGRWPSRPGG